MPAVVAYAMGLRIFNDGKPVLNADQVAHLPNCHGAAPEVPDFLCAVKTGGVPVNVIVDVLPVHVGADNKGMVAF